MRICIKNTKLIQSCLQEYEAEGTYRIPRLGNYLPALGLLILGNHCAFPQFPAPHLVDHCAFPQCPALQAQVQRWCPALVDCQTPWGKDALPFIIAFISSVHQAQPPVPPGLVCLQRMWKVAHVRESCCWEEAVGCVWNGRLPRQTSKMRPVDILWDALPQLHCPFRSWTQFILHQRFRVHLPRMAVS